MHSTAVARRNPAHGKREQGYILLTLLLTMSLLIIAAGIAASSISFSIRRDREEELIHRGAQYTRAIREFTKRTGRFPMRLDELDNTDGRRFLRKHYKDPITGKDFKLVHMIDVQLSTNTTPVAAGDTNAAAGTDTETDAPNAGVSGTQPVTPGSSGNPQSFLGQNGQIGLGNGNSAASGSFSSSGQSASFSGSSGQPISTGLIVGVVSSSTDKTIREFSRKKHYNEWRFYYDTAFDQFYLRNAPTERLSPLPAAPLSAASSPAGTFQQPPQPTPATTQTNQ